MTLQVAPLLRQVPGIVEVNSWGGEERTLEVRAEIPANPDAPLRANTYGSGRIEVARLGTAVVVPSAVSAGISRMPYGKRGRCPNNVGILPSMILVTRATFSISSSGVLA